MINIISKVSVVGLLLLALTQSVNASSDHNGVFYITPKVVYTLGDNFVHNGHLLEGDPGYGIGIDFGYAFTKNYGIEFDTTYVEADVTGEHNHHRVKDKAEYTTYAINAVYIRNLTGHLNLALKVGYEWEYEKIDHLEIKETVDGVDYAVGIEYAIDEHMEVDFEYEASTVKGTRGAAFFLGLKYLF